MKYALILSAAAVAALSLAACNKPAGTTAADTSAAAGQIPAAKLDSRRQGFLDNLTKASDADFDKTYVDQQVAAHEEALSLMQGYGKDGSDAGLKGAANKTVPIIQMHLDKIKAIQAKMKT
jgi:putative membrane protein